MIFQSLKNENCNFRRLMNSLLETVSSRPHHSCSPSADVKSDLTDGDTSTSQQKYKTASKSHNCPLIKQFHIRFFLCILNLKVKVRISIIIAISASVNTNGRTFWWILMIMSGVFCCPSVGYKEHTCQERRLFLFNIV